MERAALITGGSSGIGLAIARMLRDEGFGLTLASRRPERVEAAAAELGAAAVAADVASAEACARLVAEHRERFGRLDVLVNSAGIGIAGRVEDLPAKHFDLQLGVNLRGLFLVTQAAIPLLRESRGWIVNLASIAGTIPSPGLATYGATKAAVISLTRSLNEELDGDGVRAVAICPGFVDTPMAEWSGLKGEEMIQPEDCAEIVRMLLRLSPRARIPQVVDRARRLDERRRAARRRLSPFTQREAGPAPPRERPQKPPWTAWLRIPPPRRLPSRALPRRGGGGISTQSVPPPSCNRRRSFRRPSTQAQAERRTRR